MHPLAPALLRMPAMRALALALCCTLAPAVAIAQDTAIVIQPESGGVLLEPPELPRLVAEEAIRRYNAPTTTRLVGRSRLPPGNESRGALAVRDAPLCLPPPVQGTARVIHGFAFLDSTAAI